MHRKCLYLAVSFLVGIILSYYFRSITTLLISVVFLALIVFFLLTDRRYAKHLLFILLAFLSGYIYCRCRINDSNTSEFKELYKHLPSKCSFELLVLEPLQVAYQDEGQFTYKFDALARRLEFKSNITYSNPIKLRCYLRSRTNTNIKAGNILRVKAKLYKPAITTNPGQIDYSIYYERRNIVVRTYINANQIEIVGYTPPFWPVRLLHKVRLNLAGILDKTFDESNGRNIVNAIVLGQRDSIIEEKEELYMRTGVVHFFALSGLHVAVFGYFLWWTFSIFPFSRRFRIFFVIVGLLSYCLIGGATVSLLRATIMGVLYLGAELFNRQRDTLNIIGASALIIMLINPLDALSIGFQLSFSAVLSIVLLGPLLKKFQTTKGYLLFKLQQPEERGFIDHIRVVISESITIWIFISFAAWLGTAPIVAYHFNIITPVSILLSVVIAPAIWSILILGIITILSALIYTPLAKSFALLISLLAEGMENLLLLFNRPPFYFYIPNGFMPKFNLLSVILWYSVFILIALRLRTSRPKWKYVAVSFFLFNSMYFLSPMTYQSKLNHSITVLDVGRGSAFVVKTSDGSTLLYDCGGGHEKVGTDIISPFLWRNNIFNIDTIIISHPDADHYIALETLLERFRIGSIITTEYFYLDEEAGEVTGRINLYGVSYNIVNYGQDINIGNARLKVLGPQTNYVFYSNLSDNNTSLVLNLKDKGATYMLTGDAETAETAMIVDSGADLEADIFIVPHHGGKNPLVTEFYRRSKADFAVISGGYNQAAIMTDLSQEKTKLLLTEIHGAITIKYRDGKYLLDTYIKP